MRLAAVAVFVLVVLTGCSTFRGRTEVMSFTADDGTWILSTLMMVSQIEAAHRAVPCGLMPQPLRAVLVNHGKTPIGGSFIVTVASQARTLGEFTVHCQIAVPGGSAACTAESLKTAGRAGCQDVDQDVHLYARPLSN